MTGSWKGRGNQYIQFARVVYCKLPTNGKQLPAFPLKAMTGIEPRPQRWEARVLPLCHHGPLEAMWKCYRFLSKFGRAVFWARTFLYEKNWESLLQNCELECTNIQTDWPTYFRDFRNRKFTKLYIEIYIIRKVFVADFVLLVSCCIKICPEMVKLKLKAEGKS